MAPRKTRAVPTTAAESNSNTITSGPVTHFPHISPKSTLNCHALLDDQILLVNGFLDSEECRALVKFVDDQSLELIPPKKKGEAVRVNYRVSLTSADIAKQLFNLLTPHLPPFPYPLSRRTSGTSTRPVHSFNPNIRLYKYTPGQHFGPHYDDSVRDPLTGAKSEWTVLLYITGIEDGVKGGEVRHSFPNFFETEFPMSLGPRVRRLYFIIPRRGDRERLLLLH
ncbi:hypothetical protein AcW1_005815 [Taiwanofungus camphoratus]|nr:hypothetical protein AcW1_005815 [Antrodia cinnamomea]